jgi:hypothetical protein
MINFHLNTHRLFFCINSGRSGSEYLAELLGSAKEVKSYHEAEPTMTGKYLHMINNAPYHESFRARRMKSTAIKRILRSFSPEIVYCETNHMFIKTFFDVILKDFKNVEVIILRRDLSLVLKSFIELNYFSHLNTSWPDWMSVPNAKTAAISCAESYQDMDQYDRCIAYLIDIEARAQRFKKQYNWIKTYELRLEALSDFNYVSELFRDLNITPTEQTTEIIGKVINDRALRKLKFNNTADLDYCRKRIMSYIKRAESMGISLPQSLALKPYVNEKYG